MTTSTRRRTLGAFEKLRLRIDYITTRDGVRALAQRHDTNLATVSRCTSGSGFDRKRPAALQVARLGECWNREAGPKAHASQEDIVRLVMGLTLHTPAADVICGSLETHRTQSKLAPTERIDVEQSPAAGTGRKQPEAGLL